MNINARPQNNESDIMKIVQVSEPRIYGEEITNVIECLTGGWISSQGRFIEEFEHKWSAYCGMRYGVAVCNGTVALQLAVKCLDLKPGEEVIMPAYTIISCALAVIYNGGIPVLVDADPKTWCMDVSQIEAKITPRTRAIMPVHIFGHPVDMDVVNQIARKHELVVIEDAAEAHGAGYKGKRCGGLGDISCFSFYANKIITTGEGGMVLTSDQKYYERLLSLRNLCFRTEKRFSHVELGHNFRMTNLQAAIGVGQLEHINDALDHKLWMKAAYESRLKKLVGLQLPTEKPWARNVYWMYGVVLDKSLDIDAAKFAERLLVHGIMTRPFFVGMHEQPVFKKRGIFVDEKYPVSERIASYGLYLPSGLTLTQNQIDRVCDAVEHELVILKGN